MASHRRAVLSEAAEAIRLPSELKATSTAAGGSGSASCLPRYSSSDFVPAQNRTIWSSPIVARRPPAPKASARTGTEPPDRLRGSGGALGSHTFTEWSALAENRRSPVPLSRVPRLKHTPVIARS